MFLNSPNVNLGIDNDIIMIFILLENVCESMYAFVSLSNSS